MFRDNQTNAITSVLFNIFNFFFFLMLVDVIQYLKISNYLFVGVVFKTCLAKKIVKYSVCTMILIIFK